MRPEPPGPPGLTSMMPWNCESGTVWRMRDTAMPRVLPFGFE